MPFFNIKRDAEVAKKRQTKTGTKLYLQSVDIVNSHYIYSQWTLLIVTISTVS